MAQSDLADSMAILIAAIECVHKIEGESENYNNLMWYLNGVAFSCAMPYINTNYISRGKKND